MNVMQIGRTPQTIAAHPDRPYKTFAEVAADAKARPEQGELRRAGRQPGAGADDADQEGKQPQTST